MNQQQQYPRSTIKVYKDHPDWNKHAKWFMMPSWLLSKLFVAKYEVQHDESPTAEDIDYVEKLHPGCVYIY